MKKFSRFAYFKENLAAAVKDLNVELKRKPSEIAEKNRPGKVERRPETAEKNRPGKVERRPETTDDKEKKRSAGKNRFRALRFILNLIVYPFKLCALIIIVFYRSFISAGGQPVCRHCPTCSSYALQAFKTLPFIEALFLSILRILRCNPLVKPAYDPVPEPGYRAFKTYILNLFKKS